MALRFFEGFESREPAGRFGLAYNGLVSFVTGRTTGSAVRTNGSNVLVVFSMTTGANPTIVVSAAVRIDALTAANITDLIRLSGGNVQARLHLIGTTGQLRIVAQGSTELTTTYSMAVGEWTRIELKVHVNNAPSGYMELWVNGVKVGELTGVDTQSTDAVVNSVTFGLGSNNSSRVTIDDCYGLDSSGAAPYNDRLGDVRIECLVPNANGDASQLLGSDGNSVDNYALVDEMPYAAGDHVSGAAGLKDLYNMTDLSIPAGRIYAVQSHLVLSKTDSGAALAHPLVKQAGVEVKESGLGLSLTPTYALSDIHTAAPDGTDWTVSKVNSAQFGVEAG